MLRFPDEAAFAAFNDKRAKKKGIKSVDITEMKVPKALREVRTLVSPHGKALAYLASHPEDFEGKQEHYEQVMVFDYFERNDAIVYEALYAIPNGGLRNKGTAGRIKAEGGKRGELDINLDIARGAYHGLRIELKYGKNTATDEQKVVIERHTRNGYLALVVWGHGNCIAVIKAYMDLSPGDTLEITV